MPTRSKRILTPARFLAGFAACLLMLACTATARSESDLSTSLVQSNTYFGIELFSVLAQDSPDGNLFLSPYSISTALAMTWAGAEGATARQMADVLGFALPEEEVHGQFADLQQKLGPEYRQQYMMGSGDPLTLEVANAIWAQESYPLLPEFVSLLQDKYGAEARNVDFVGDAEGARGEINAWVEEKTRDRIQNLLPRGSVDAMTRMVITNAVYFKGSWSEPFSEDATTREDFHLADNTTAEVPMMHQTEELAYAEAAGCRAVELPYADNMSSMLVLLPDGDLSEFEQDFSTETLDEIAAEMQSREVVLSMPSFEFTSSFGLSQTLKSMGMIDAFEPGQADFTGMTEARELYISAVIHKAFVKVDEEGTEAAAATAVVMALTSMPPQLQRVELVLDRPFLFLIRDRVTGSVLFMGRMADPSA